MLIEIDSFPPEVGHVRLTKAAETAIRVASLITEQGQRSRIVSTIGEQIMATLINTTDTMVHGTGEAAVIAHSLWEEHPILSHQPDHGAFIAGISDAQRKAHMVRDFAELREDLTIGATNV